MTRIEIYAKDIVQLTGKSESTARKIIREVKIALKKEKHHILTIREYCNHFGLNHSEVTLELSKNNKLPRTVS